MATTKKGTTVRKRKQTGPKDGTSKKDPQTIAKTDPNKFSAMSLAEKLKERKRMNREALNST